MSKPRSRLDFLDALRGLAATAVVLFHFSSHPDSTSGGLGSPFTWLTQFGHAAVYVFFVLSGFVLPWAMDRSGYKLTAGGVWKFLRRRLFRLWPPCALLLLLMAIHRHGYFGWSQAWPELWPQLSYTCGILGKPRYLEIFWTLELEMQYYLLIALVFPLLVHRNPVLRRLLMLAFCVSPLPFEQREWLPHYLGFFAMGTAIFLWRSNRCQWSEMAGWILLALYGSQRDYSWLNLGAGVLAVGIILLQPPVGKWLVGLGSISYSLYLTHLMASEILGKWLPRTAETASGYVGVILIHFIFALGIASCFYYIIEKPSQKWASKVR